MSSTPPNPNPSVNPNPKRTKIETKNARDTLLTTLRTSLKDKKPFTYDETCRCGKGFHHPECTCRAIPIDNPEYVSIETQLRQLVAMQFCKCGHVYKPQYQYCPLCGTMAFKSPPPHSNCHNWQARFKYCPDCSHSTFSS